MSSTYKKAKTQHGHWLDAVPSSSSSPTTFPDFSLLPFELQTQIWEYAAVPEDHQPIPPLLDLALKQHTQSSAITDASPWSTEWKPIVFFPSVLRLSPAFLRGLETTNNYQRSKYPTLYAALWRRLAISSQYDLGRALAQACRLSRLVVLKELKRRMDGMSVENRYDDGKAIGDIRKELVIEIQEWIDDVGVRLKSEGEQ